MFDLSASAANNLCVVTAVHAERQPEEWPEKAEKTNSANSCYTKVGRGRSLTV